MFIIVNGQEVLRKDVLPDHELYGEQELVEVETWPLNLTKHQVYYDKGQVKPKTQTMLNAEALIIENARKLQEAKEKLIDMIASSATLDEIKTKINIATPITKSI